MSLPARALPTEPVPPPAARPGTRIARFRGPGGGALAWLVAVALVTAGLAQGEVLWRNRCRWFGICPSPGGQDGDEAGAWNVSLLERMLKEDYSGRDDGAIEQDRPDTPTREDSPGWMPAGDPTGELTKAGGAREVDSTPQRRKPRPSTPTPAAPRVPEVVVADDAVVEATPQPEVDADDADGADALGLVPEEPVEEPVDATPDAPLTEQEEGWGVPDWFDSAPEPDRISYVIGQAEDRLKLDPNNPDALSVLAYYQFLSEDLDAAEATYDRLIQMFPTDPAAYNNKALLYKRRGDYAREEQLLRLALAMDPGDSTAMNNLAVNLAHQGRFDEAWLIMRKLEVELPNDAYTDLHRAKIAGAQGDDPAALAYLEKALAGARKLDLLHHIEFRQDIRVDPAFSRLRDDARFRAVLTKYYGADSPIGP